MLDGRNAALALTFPPALQKEREDRSDTSSHHSFEYYKRRARTAMGHVGAEMASKRASIIHRIGTTLGLRRETDDGPPAGAALTV